MASKDWFQFQTETGEEIHINFTRQHDTTFAALTMSEGGLPIIGTTGVAYRNPIDKPDTLIGRGVALVRALAFVPSYITYWVLQDAYLRMLYEQGATEGQLR